MQKIKSIIKDVRNDILYNKHLSNEIKFKLLDIINNSEIIKVDEVNIQNKKYTIKLSKITKYHLLHEIFHIFLSHGYINRNKIHNPCIIENYIYDYIVDDYIEKYFDIKTNKHKIYNKLAEYNIEPKLESIFTLSCDKCEYNKQLFEYDDNINDTYYTENQSIKHIKQKLYEYIRDITKKTIVPIKHRNYIKSKYYMISKKDKLKEINIVIDTSTSIDMDVINMIIHTCKEVESNYNNINIYGFSDIVYRLSKTNFRYINKTNFYNVYNIFKNSDNVILISDLEFTDEELMLLDNTNFRVIQI